MQRILWKNSALYEIKQSNECSVKCVIAIFIQYTLCASNAIMT
jgi:hypothetical protein